MRTGLICLVVVSLVFCQTSRAADNRVIDSPMYRLPDPPALSVVYVLPKQATTLWLKALERPEAEMKVKAAGAIALAQRRGLKGLESTVTPLRAALNRPNEQPIVRVAIARALIALNAKETAGDLWRHVQSGGSDLREAIEPALAQWDHRPARAAWLERLRSTSTPQRSLVLAIRGLATVGEKEAIDRLRELVLSNATPVTVRLEAAQALGSLQPEGLEKDAQRLLADTSSRGRIVRVAAAYLLRRHQSKEAIALLQKMVQDKEPGVAALAVSRLIEIDPALVVESLPALLGGSDPKLRLLATVVLFRQPNEKHIRLLGDRLQDPHSEVRIKARQSLFQLGQKKEFREAVIAQGTRILGTDLWSAQEQATILLTQLDHKPAAERLVELLKVTRPEVYVTAAWGLRKLAVADTLPAVTAYVKAERELDLSKRRDAVWLDHQLSQLNQLLGQEKYRPAEALLRQFVPRDDARMIPEARTAAIWALGLLLEGKTDDALAKALLGRLHDTMSLPPEDERVRYMAAITLGRLKAKAALSGLRKYCPKFEPTQDAVSNACCWAIAQITGKRVPASKSLQRAERDWFLTPVD